MDFVQIRLAKCGAFFESNFTTTFDLHFVSKGGCYNTIDGTIEFIIRFLGGFWHLSCDLYVGTVVCTDIPISTINATTDAWRTSVVVVGSALGAFTATLHQ